MYFFLFRNNGIYLNASTYLYWIVLMGWSLLPNALRPFQIYFAPPNLGIRTWVMPIKFCSGAYFFRLEVLKRAWNLRRGTLSLKPLPEDLCLGFLRPDKSIDLSRIWTREPWISRRARYPETTEADRHRDNVSASHGLPNNSLLRGNHGRRGDHWAHNVMWWHWAKVLASVFLFYFFPPAGITYSFSLLCTVLTAHSITCIITFEFLEFTSSDCAITDINPLLYHRHLTYEFVFDNLRLGMFPRIVYYHAKYIKLVFMKDLSCY